MKYIDADLLRKEIEQRLKRENEILWNAKKRGTYPSPSCEYNLLTLTSLRDFLDSLPEQPVTDHHEIEVEFRGEKVTVNREFYRDGEMNYSTSEQDDNAIWAALRAWCEKKGITPFELYPKQSEQPVEGLEEAAEKYAFMHSGFDPEDGEYDVYDHEKLVAFIAGAKWQKDQDQKTIELAEDHAMLAGMNKMEQQMMEKAVETQILTISFINLPKEYLHQNGIQAGDKVRVIVIPNTDEK